MMGQSLVPQPPSHTHPVLRLKIEKKINYMHCKIIAFVCCGSVCRMNALFLDISWVRAFGVISWVRMTL